MSDHKWRLKLLERFINGPQAKRIETTDTLITPEEGAEPIEYLKITSFEGDGSVIATVLLPKNGRDPRTLK